MATISERFAVALKYYETGNLQQAEQVCREIVQANPQVFDALHLLGLIAHQVGRNDIAVDYLRQAVRLKSDHAQVRNNLGIVLEAQGKLDEALASYQQAVRLQPGFAAARGNLGNALRQKGQLDEASVYCAEAVRLEPANPEAHNNLGSNLLEQGKLEEAIACFQHALRLRPDYVKARNNLGAALLDQGKVDEAIACFQEVLRLKPDFADAHHNLGNAAKEAGNLQEALACYQRGMPLKANFHLSQGLLRLLTGDFEGGWPEYEWRWQRPESPPRPFRQPLWDGSALNGRTILLHAEQGLGDTLHFIRFGALVKQRGGRVVVECQKALLGILARCEGVDQWIGAGSPLPDFAVHAPLLSLPGIMGITLTTVPANVPYVYADPTLVENWRRELGSLPSYKIGIAWQGSPMNKKDRQRSIPLVQFAPLAQVPGVHLLSLQKGYGTEQLREVADRFAVLDLGSRLDEASGAFMDTAAVMKNLDLVITSDTATAHLAGALGVPVWTALPFMPDWRWLLERSDSPWYPTMRLFRQRQRGDWAEVFEHMARALADQLGTLARAPGICVDIAPGELVDRITILEIKSARVTDADKLQNIRTELAQLAAARDGAIAPAPELDTLTAELKAVNEQLWDIEDAIRLCERQADFGARFIELARAVYRTNDVRAALKRRINELLGSTIVEEKSYADYAGH